jgi:hypothetical protein
MSDQSSMHYYFNWSKERIDEMEAALASFERQYDRLQADARTQAQTALGKMREARDAFRDTVTKQAKVGGDSDWARATAGLESGWKDFEAQASKYVDTLGKQTEQYQATFRACAEAQMKAWQESAERMHEAASAFAADQRAAFDTMADKMKADASAAQAKLANLGAGGVDSWSVLTAALSETRAAFDRANRTAQEAFERARKH